MNGKKTLVFALVALLCGSMSAFALIQCGWQATQGGGAPVLSDMSTALPLNSLAAVGLFPGLNDAQIAALGGSGTALWAAFSPFESEPADANGLFNGDGQSHVGAGFFSSQAYIICFDAATAASAGQWGVFKGASVGNVGDAWIFPAADNNAMIPTFTMENVPASGVIVGSFGALAYAAAWAQDTDSPGTEYVDAYALIPEPSTYMLVGTGLLGLLALRRRRS